MNLYHADGRKAVISVEPATRPGSFLLRLGGFEGGTVYGPLPAAEVDAARGQLMERLLSEGFEPGLQGYWLGRLADPASWIRARAIRRLAWIGDAGVIARLLDHLTQAVDERCDLLDALGVLAERYPDAPARARLLEVLALEAGRKLLSRRRSAQEALRRAVGKAADGAHLLDVAEAAARNALPKAVRTAGEDPLALSEALTNLPPKERGLACDNLYVLAARPGLETGSEPASSFDPISDAIREALGSTQLGQPHLWRYAKSILKRAMLRGDYRMVGWLNHQIEAEGRTNSGTRATVKSGYDGKKRETPIFSRATQGYVRRSIWRFLDGLARRRPADFAPAVAWCLVHYGADDLLVPKGSYGRFADCYVPTKALFGGGDRFVYAPRTLKAAFRNADAAVAPPPEIREETHAELWDRAPAAYLILLVHARVDAMHEMAVRAVRERHPTLLQRAASVSLLGMLKASFDGTRLLAARELDRRFDPQAPPWELLEGLLGSELEAIRLVGERWLGACRDLWVFDQDRLLALLEVPNGATRSCIVQLALNKTPGSKALYDLPPAKRMALAARLWARLIGPESEPGWLAAHASLLLEGLHAEIDALLPTAALIAQVETGTATDSPSAVSVAANLLAARADAKERLGIPGLLALADHELAAARAAAHRLLRDNVQELHRAPALLFNLVENRWDDTRALAIAMIQTYLAPTVLDLDRVIAFCDSNRRDVQALGQRLVSKHRRSPQLPDLLYRLTEHPDLSMRRFAFDLLDQALPDGALALARVTPLLRSLLFDLHAARRDKDRVIDLLTRRGERDADQARIGLGILGDLLGTHTQVDFERILTAMARIKLAHPVVSAPIRLLEAS